MGWPRCWSPAPCKQNGLEACLPVGYRCDHHMPITCHDGAAAQRQPGVAKAGQLAASFQMRACAWPGQQAVRTAGLPGVGAVLPVVNQNGGSAVALHGWQQSKTGAGWLALQSEQPHAAEPSCPLCVPAPRAQRLAACTCPPPRASVQRPAAVHAAHAAALTGLSRPDSRMYT